jgi:hypothetical protein
LTSCSGGVGDYIEDLPGGYQFVSESNEQSFIYGNSNQYVACTVIAYTYDENFILICQKPSEPCIHTEATGISVKKIDIIQFWIVDIHKDTLLGPFTLSEYLKKRNSMGISDRLTLKLEF